MSVGIGSVAIVGCRYRVSGNSLGVGIGSVAIVGYRVSGNSWV